MKSKTHLPLILTVFISAMGGSLPAEASLNLIGSGNWLGPNLVANGSFEIGSPAPGTANNLYWASGTSFTPFSNIPGWTSSGAANNYAVWGSDETTGPYHLRASDVLPDGQAGVYFGNGEQRGVSPAPTFNPDFTVSFSSPPTFGGPGYGGPVTLSQTIPTDLNPSPTYGLSFWVSGEGADTSTALIPGIFGLQLSNTEVGDPIHYLAVPPGASSAFGKSHVFQFEFTPLDATQPVTLQFFNYGHAGNPFPSTELVLDDVRVTIETVPEPSALPLLGFGLALGAATVRRWHSTGVPPSSAHN